MPQVLISPTFWKKEREQAYSNPRLAVWRELFQNSIDQDVTAIDIGLRWSDDGSYVILTFADNGPGMTRDVLDRVYFNIGNSTKDTDPTKIGGMGRARILTCFAMQGYRLLSQGYHVVGQGGTYEVYDHPWTNGCKLVIQVDGYDLDSMQRSLDQFLRESRITARMTLNGERLPNKASLPGRHVRNLQIDDKVFAKIWVNKSVKSHDAIVRVNGVSMFSIHVNASAQVLVELEPSLARYVLTANRDGLRNVYRVALDRFLAELAVDTNSSLRSRLGRRTTVVRGGGMKVVRANKADRQSAQTFNPDAVAFGENLHAGMASGLAPSDYLSRAHVDDTYEEVATFDTWLSNTFGDIYLFDEAETGALRKAIPAYNPSGWQVSYKHIRGTSRPYRKGGNLIRLLLLWHTAISYALEIALSALGKTDVPFAVGFVFAETKLADHREQDNGHVFCLRPVNTEGKFDFASSNPRDLRRLMAYAQHEVVHIRHHLHHEDFASIREQVAIEFDHAECLRRMKAALQSAKGM